MARRRGVDLTTIQTILRSTRQRVSFSHWLKETTPSWSWDWPHIVHIGKYLKRVTDGDIKRLMLTIPPRHGKSEMVTVRYPVYRLEDSPSLSIIIGAYNQKLANKFSRKARRVGTERLSFSTERCSVEDWETTSGGGMRAVGVGGGITGHGGDLIVVDDPIKSREEAESEAYRERVWDWWTDDLYTRLEPGGAMIIIMTRWHEDDLIGRILSGELAGEWTAVSLPAEAEENDPLNRNLGEPLCPDRYDAAALEDRRQVLGSYAFSALFQQRPAPPEGGMAEEGWFTVLDVVPADTMKVRAWDFAATKAKTMSERGPDWTVGTLLGFKSDDWFVEDIVRERVTPGAVFDLVCEVAERDGKGVPIVFEEEGGSSGKMSSYALVTRLSGWIIEPVHVTGDKVSRAMSFLSQARVGNVKLKRALWNKAWLREIANFPVGTYDDQVDSASLGFNKMKHMYRKAKIRVVELAL